MVRKYQVLVRRLKNKVQRHDRLFGTGLDEDEQGRKDAKYDEGCNHDRMRPREDVSAESLYSLVRSTGVIMHADMRLQLEVSHLPIPK